MGGRGGGRGGTSVRPSSARSLTFACRVCGCIGGHAGAFPTDGYETHRALLSVGVVTWPKCVHRGLPVHETRGTQPHGGVQPLTHTRTRARAHFLFFSLSLSFSFFLFAHTHTLSLSPSICCAAWPALKWCRTWTTRAQGFCKWCARQCHLRRGCRRIYKRKRVHMAGRSGTRAHTL